MRLHYFLILFFGLCLTAPTRGNSTLKGKEENQNEPTSAAQGDLTETNVDTEAILRSIKAAAAAASAKGKYALNQRDVMKGRFAANSATRKYKLKAAVDAEVKSAKVKAATTAAKAKQSGPEVNANANRGGPEAAYLAPLDTTSPIVARGFFDNAIVQVFRMLKQSGLINDVIRMALTDEEVRGAVAEITIDLVR